MSQNRGRGRVRGAISKDRSIDAEALREVLKPIYEKLRGKGVADDDLPNNEDLVDRLLRCAEWSRGLGGKMAATHLTRDSIWPVVLSWLGCPHIRSNANCGGSGHWTRILEPTRQPYTMN